MTALDLSSYGSPNLVGFGNVGKFLVKSPCVDCTARVEKMHQKLSDLVLPGPPFAGRLAELAAKILKAGLF